MRKTPRKTPQANLATPVPENVWDWGVVGASEAPLTRTCRLSHQPLGAQITKNTIDVQITKNTIDSPRDLDWTIGCQRASRPPVNAAFGDEFDVAIEFVSKYSIRGRV